MFTGLLFTSEDQTISDPVHQTLNVHTMFERIGGITVQ